MSKLIGATMLAMFVLMPVAAAADQCGLPPMAPMPPMGCRAMQPQCVCDANGNCYWTFVCVR